MYFNTAQGKGKEQPRRGIRKGGAELLLLWKGKRGAFACFRSTRCKREERAGIAGPDQREKKAPRPPGASCPKGEEKGAAFLSCARGEKNKRKSASNARKRGGGEPCSLEEKKRRRRVLCPGSLPCMRLWEEEKGERGQGGCLVRTSDRGGGEEGDTVRTGRQLDVQILCGSEGRSRHPLLTSLLARKGGE